MLTSAERHSARQEFSSLRAFARIETAKTPGVTQYEILLDMIDVPSRQRHVIEQFCDQNPTDAVGFEHALAVRDYMLELLEECSGT